MPSRGWAGLGRAYRTAVTASRWLVVAFWVAAAALVTILIPSSTGGGGGFGSSRHHRATPPCHHPADRRRRRRGDPLVVAQDAVRLTWPRRHCVNTGRPPGTPSSSRHPWPSVCSSLGAPQHSSPPGSEPHCSVPAWLDAMCRIGTPRKVAAATAGAVSSAASSPSSWRSTPSEADYQSYPCWPYNSFPSCFSPATG